MSRSSVPSRVPLLESCEEVELNESAEGWPQGLKQVSEVKIHIPQKLPESCFALEVPNIFEESVKGEPSFGVFGPEINEKALHDVHILGLKGQKPFLCKVVKNEAKPNIPKEDRSKSSSPAKNPRKSFMTPTPLHIPDSRVSPIPDSSHEMIYVRDLNGNEGLKVVPVQDVVWMRPLIVVTAQSPD